MDKYVIILKVDKGKDGREFRKFFGKFFFRKLLYKLMLLIQKLFLKLLWFLLKLAPRTLPKIFPELNSSEFNPRPVPKILLKISGVPLAFLEALANWILLCLISIMNHSKSLTILSTILFSYAINKTIYRNPIFVNKSNSARLTSPTKAPAKAGRKLFYHHQNLSS